MQSALSFDALVIGGGPAGISAALALSRTRRSVALFDSGLYRNANAVNFHTVPGSDGGDPHIWRKAAQKQLFERYETATFFKSTVLQIERLTSPSHKGTAFRAKDSEGNILEARKIVLAVGVTDRLTDVAGLDTLWGKQAIHCVYCHGTETDGHSAGLLLTQNPAINGLLIPSFFKKWINLKHEPLYIFTNGIPLDQLSGLTDHIRKLAKRKGVEWVTDRIQEVKTSSCTSPVDMTFVASSRAPLKVDFIITFAEKILPSPHAQQLLSSLGPELGPINPVFGIIPAMDNTDPNKPNMNAQNPATQIEGVYWAGNIGNAVAGVNIAVVNGQAAGMAADDAMGLEDMAALAEA